MQLHTVRSLNYTRDVRRHEYMPEILWTGNIGKGTVTYDGYNRSHSITVPCLRKAEGILGSADPTFRGDSDRWNPEELFVSSLSACHMLWYLHLCAEAGVTVTSYRDEPVGRMELDIQGGGRFVSVILRPRILLTAESDVDLARSLHEQAHGLCFIAASVACPVTVEPVIRHRWEPRLEELVCWGRSAEEYRLMFNLRDQDLRVRVLGCGDGPASFNAAVRESGGFAVSVDPLYEFSRTQIEARIETLAPQVLVYLEEHKRNYRWSIWESPTSAVDARRQAMARFIADYETGKDEGRYLAASLPNLPFSSNSFDLALVSHLLFLESDILDLDFHLASLAELSRIAIEVRVYPLLDPSGERSRHLQAVKEELTSMGYVVNEVLTNYEFQKGADRYLSVSHSHRRRPRGSA